MCMKTDCDKCDKPTWKGCGKHIEQALKDVPEDERCKCPRDSTTNIKKTEEEKSIGGDVINKQDHAVEIEQTTVTTEETQTKTD